MKYIIALTLFSLSMPALAYSYRCSVVNSPSPTYHHECSQGRCWDYTFVGGPLYIGFYLGVENLFRVGDFHRSTLKTTSPTGYTQFEGKLGQNGGSALDGDAELQVEDDLMSSQNPNGGKIIMNYEGKISDLECH